MYNVCYTLTLVLHWTGCIIGHVRFAFLAHPVGSDSKSDVYLGLHYIDRHVSNPTNNRTQNRNAYTICSLHKTYIIVEQNIRSVQFIRGLDRLESDVYLCQIRLISIYIYKKLYSFLASQP